MTKARPVPAVVATRLGLGPLDDRDVRVQHEGPCEQGGIGPGKPPQALLDPLRGHRRHGGERRVADAGHVAAHRLRPGVVVAQRAWLAPATASVHTKAARQHQCDPARAAESDGRRRARRGPRHQTRMMGSGSGPV